VYGNNWLRVFSGLALLVTCVIVVAQSLLRNEFANQLYYGTTLIAVFGYIFLRKVLIKRGTSIGKARGDQATAVYCNKTSGLANQWPFAEDCVAR